VTLPRGLLGAGLVFWGWQSGQLLVGIALALLVEAPRWTTVRFELRGTDFARISDLTALVFLALAAALAATRGMSEGVLGTMQWLPVVLAPQEHRASIWLPWREAAEKCFSWSNRDAILLLGERGGI